MHAAPEITSRDEGEVHVVEIRGEHDIASAPDLRVALESALTATRTGVVADLTPASFIDSTVLGVLLGGRERARELGRGFAVLLSADDGQLAVRRIIEVTGLGPILPVHETQEAAVAAAGLPGV